MDLAKLGLEIDSRGYVKATRDGDRFAASAARAEKSTEKLAKQARQMGRAFALAAAAGIAIAIRQLRVITREADRIQKLTIQTGLSAESLQRLGFAAEQAGSNMESMARANLLLQRNIQSANDGLATQARAFDRIGVSLASLQGMSPEQQFLHIADALSKITDPTIRNASAFDLFGRSAQDLLPLLSAGGKEIADLGKQFEATGAMMSTDMVHAAARFNDIMNRLQLQIKGISVQLADGMMPILEATAELFLKTAGDADTLTNAGTKLAQGLNVLIRAAVVVQTVFKVAGEAIAAQATIAVGALQVMLAPIEAFTNALMGSAAALKDGDFRGARDAVRGLGDDMSNLANEGMLRMQEGMKGFSQEIPKIVQGAAEMLGKLESAVHATNKEIEETAAVTSAAAEAFSAEFEKSLTQLAASMGGEVARAQQAFNDQVEAATVLLKENEIGAGQHTRAIALYRQELDRIVNGAQKAFLDQIQDIEDELSGPAARAQTQFNRLIKEADDLLAGGTITLDHHTRAIAAYQAQLHAAGGVGTTFGIDFDFIFSGLDQVMAQMYEIAQIDWEIDNLTDSFDPLIGQMRRLGEEIALIDRALNENLISEAQAGFLKTGVTANAAFGAIMSGMDQSSKEYRQMEIAQQAVNVAMGIAAILQQGTGDPYTAIPRMIAMAAMVASLVGSIGGLSGGGGGAASRQQQQGTGSVLGDPGAQSESIVRATEITASATESLVGINQSMLRALQSMNDAITGASTSIARGGFGDVDLPTIGTSIGQFGPGLGFKIDDWLGGLFGFNKTKLRDEGIALFSGTISEIIDQGIGQAFAEVRKKGLFGSKTKTGFGDLAGDVTGQIELLLNSMVDAVSAGAAALGISQAEIERAIDSFHIQAQQISLMDLSPADQQAALEAVFSSIFDGLAGAVVPFIGQFQKIGEGLGETLIRVATGVQVTQEAMARLGFALDETDPEKFAQASEGLLAMTGGIDGLIAGMDNFINKFASDAVKFEIAQSDITRAMEQAGLELPATADGFWELMQTLDATTEEGQRQIATLLALADAADIYFSGLERIQSERERLERRELELMGDTAALRALELEKLDESNRGIQERIWSLEAEAAIASERAGLDRRLLELQGDTIAIRELELSALDESNRAIQERIWELEKEAAVSSEKAGLMRQLQEALGMTAQIREAELAALDESNRALQERIWRIQDELAIRAERADLELRELELLGDTVAIRALELAKLDESNRALQERIWRLEDEQAMMAKFESFQIQYLRLQGDIEAIRAIELESLDRLNQAAQRRVWRLEDQIALTNLLNEADMAHLQTMAPAVASLKQLSDRWVGMEDAAIALGASEEQLARVRRAAHAELSRWISDTTLSILELADDFFSVDQAFSQVGSSITSTVTNMRDLALRALGSIDDWLMKSQLSNVSPLTPTERLGEAESQFMSAFAAAMGGDFGALADLPGLADAFLGEAGGFFGTSTDQFRDIWDMVRAMMSQAADIEPPPEMQPVNAGQMNTLIETNSRFGEEIEALNLEMRAWQLADKINALAIAQGKTAAEIAEALGFTDQDMMQILTALGEDIPHGTEISLRDHFNDVVGELAAQNPIVEAMKETTSDLSDTMIFMAGVIESNLWSIGDVLVQILEQLGGEFVPSFADGGPVNHNGLANVHSGEFVVPRDGALISSGPDMSEVKQELSRISRLMERGNSDRRDGLGAVVREARSTRRSIERKTETVRAV